MEKTGDWDHEELGPRSKSPTIALTNQSTGSGTTVNWELLDLIVQPPKKSESVGIIR